ncbi:hypothetical protein [Ensifer sp. ZNC0028]|uniref:hypothetical protein n=1 Tax=Ensifer sp. ZNC0028 TaxID=1339236 RepID=UPI0005B8469A|nr:hypothetical protein [Ensifer sp. ZNC0028]
MTDDGWKMPESITLGANLMFALNLCTTLIDKGVLTRQEAANIMVETANDIRSGSEDGAGEILGEATAGPYERLAAMLLGYGTEP